MLRASSSLDLLRSTLGQKELAVAQKLIVDQRLISAHEVHWSSARTLDANGDPTQFYFAVNGESGPAVTRQPNESDVVIQGKWQAGHKLRSSFRPVKIQNSERLQDAVTIPAVVCLKRSRLLGTSSDLYLITSTT